MEQARSPSSSQQPSHRPAALAGTGRRALACATWRLLWAVPAFATVLALPQSPAKWPALALLMASVLVLHADSIARSIRRHRP